MSDAKAKCPINALMKEISSESGSGAHVTLQEPDTGFLLDSLVARIAFIQQNSAAAPVKAHLAAMSRQLVSLRLNPEDRNLWGTLLIQLIDSALANGLSSDDLLLAAHTIIDVRCQPKEAR